MSHQPPSDSSNAVYDIIRDRAQRIAELVPVGQRIAIEAITAARAGDAVAALDLDADINTTMLAVEQFHHEVNDLLYGDDEQTTGEIDEDLIALHDLCGAARSSLSHIAATLRETMHHVLTTIDHDWEITEHEIVADLRVETQKAAMLTAESLLDGSADKERKAQLDLAFNSLASDLRVPSADEATVAMREDGSIRMTFRLVADSYERAVNWARWIVTDTLCMCPLEISVDAVYVRSPNA